MDKKVLYKFDRLLLRHACIKGDVHSLKRLYVECYSEFNLQRTLYLI